MWPRKLGSCTSPTCLEVAGARLGELAGDAADLHHRHTERVGEHDRHLQDDAQLLTDVDGAELFEALRAVAGLQQERVAGGHLGQRVLQRAGLAGEDQRGIGGDLLQRTVEIALVGPLGLLLGRQCLPGRGCPRFRHGASLTARSRAAPCQLRAGGAPGRKMQTPRSEDRGAQQNVSDDQTARMRTASSRRPATARLTRRRAASAVTPRFSPTSRKLLRSPSSRPKRASTA